MPSTEETVRAAIVGAIEGIAQSDLGFDEENGNVKDYVIEHEAQSRVPNYLMALVGGKKRIRAWAVQVRGNDNWFAAGNITLRTYEILVTCYYAKGVSGEGAKLIFEHARKVRGAIRGLGSKLANTVDLVSNTEAVDIVETVGLDFADDEMLVGTFRYGAEKRNPDF